MIMTHKGYENLGNLSAVGPAYSRQMDCDVCKVYWVGCWDNFQCPKCGEGELPDYKNSQAGDTLKD